MSEYRRGCTGLSLQVLIKNVLSESTLTYTLDKVLECENGFRYNNPFEHKTVVKPEHFVSAIINPSMLSCQSRWWISKLLGVPIEYADWTHYGGCFIYNEGDFLGVHADAGRHPKNGQVKVATACLYLTPAVLNFWHGEPAYYDKPTVQYVKESLSIKANTLVLFTNDDQAWHSVPRVSDQQRVVITCSYIAPEGFKSPDYSNIRTRAYFARIEGVVDTVEEAVLREQRASETEHEGVYRV